jgi:hypothetical protein
MNLLQPLKVFFSACQTGLHPLRRLGSMGSPDDPLYFDAEEVVPWWIFCRWPLNLPLLFGCDCEVYWDGESQIVQVLERAGALGIMYSPFMPPGWNSVLLVGAPTILDGKPRPRRPRKVKSPTLAFGGAA